MGRGGIVRTGRQGNALEASLNQTGKNERGARRGERERVKVISFVENSDLFIAFRACALVLESPMKKMGGGEGFTHVMPSLAPLSELLVAYPKGFPFEFPQILFALCHPRLEPHFLAKICMHAVPRGKGKGREGKGERECR